MQEPSLKHTSCNWEFDNWWLWHQLNAQNCSATKISFQSPVSVQRVPVSWRNTCWAWIISYSTTKIFHFFKFNIWFTSCAKIIPCLYTLNEYIFTNRPWSGKYDLDQAENREKSVRYVCTQLRIRDMWQKGADFDEWTGSSWCVPPLTSVTTATPPSSAPHSCFDGTHDSPKCCTLSQLELCKSLIFYVLFWTSSLKRHLQTAILPFFDILAIFIALLSK